jgi:Ni,Fe-hydrogenase maturation factor
MTCTSDNCGNKILLDEAISFCETLLEEIKYYEDTEKQRNNKIINLVKENNKFIENVKNDNYIIIKDCIWIHIITLMILVYSMYR